MGRETISITPGSGEDVVVDNVSGEGKYQVVKLDAGGDGASTPIVAGQQTMAASLPVAVASDQTAIPQKADTLTAVTASWSSGTSASTQATIACPGMATVVIRLTGGTLVNGSIRFQRSDDGGATWHSCGALKESNAVSGGIKGEWIYQTISGSVIGSETWELRADVQGFTHFAVLLSGTISSGTLDVRLTGSAVPFMSRAIIYPDYATSSSLPISGAITDAEKVADNGAFTDGTTKVNPVGFILDETPGTALTENDIGAARMDSKRALVMVEEDATTRGQRAAVNANGGRSVAGDIAHDGVDAGNPVKIGMRAIAHGSNPSAVAAADRTDWLANRHGIPFVLGGHPNIITIEVATTGAQTDAAIVTVSSGAKIAVTQIQVVTDNANTAFPQIRVGFGTANTPTTTGVVLTHPGLPAGGGVSRGDGSGILGIGADGEDLRYTCGAPTGGSLRVLVSYFTIES